MSGIREYVYRPGSFVPLALLEGGDARRTYFYHNDPNGCPVRLITPEGETVWEAAYHARGRVRKLLHNRVDNPLRFQGQYYDGETGLHYNRHRYYNPESGSYISLDPIGLRGGLNLYAYVKNPLTWIDPLGLAGCSAQFKSRNEAFRAAKRDASIPMNQQPDRIFNSKTGFYGDHRNVPMTDSRKNPIFDSNGDQVWTREYQFTRADGTKIIIQDHSAGHSYPNGIGNQGPHLNVRPIENTRTGSVHGTFDHYEF